MQVLGEEPFSGRSLAAASGFSEGSLCKVSWPFGVTVRLCGAWPVHCQHRGAGWMGWQVRVTSIMTSVMGVTCSCSRDDVIMAQLPPSDLHVNLFLLI